MLVPGGGKCPKLVWCFVQTSVAQMAVVQTYVTIHRYCMNQYRGLFGGKLLLQSIESKVVNTSANTLLKVQLIPLPPHHVCFSKIQNDLSFW